MSPDINVLLAASRSDHPHHIPALTWLESALEACDKGGTVEILPMVAVGFLRIATNPRVFINATPIDAAIAFLNSLLSAPGVSIPEVGREWPLLKQLCSRDQFAGNAIPDAWIAAAVRSIDSHLVTFDRDFRNLLDRSEVTFLSA